jgi:exosortase
MASVNTKNILYLQLSLVGLAFLFVYYPFIEKMVTDWNHNDNYSHGYLIPFISGYMIYFIRNDLKNEKISSTMWGLFVIVLGLCQLIVAKIGSEYFLQRTSIIVVLFGITLFFWGKNIAARVSLPLIYLIFMIPIPAIIWNRIAFPMQLFASGITEQIIAMIGIPVLRQGNVLHLAQTTLEVADACSGLRSLLSMFALSSAFAFLTDLSKIKKMSLLFSALPIAILINIIRLVATAVMVRWIGEKAAQGFLHEFSGFIVFAVGLVMLFGVQVLLSKWPKYQKT